MGTIVTIDVVGDPHAGNSARDAAIDRAFEWFYEIERRCNRFDPASELRVLTERAGRCVPVSDILFSGLEFALAVADETSGAFDPTVGRRMEARGFNRDYRTGTPVASTGSADETVSYRDVHLDAEGRTILIDRPLILDLGGVAKGLAIDLAATELKPLEHFVIDAGGDLYCAGRNAANQPWSVGVRHPREDREVIEFLRVSDAAVCTSGDYERRATDGHGHHIIDPRSGAAATTMASATVIAPNAMLADALATAAFVLGLTEGLALLQRHGVNGVFYSASLERFATGGIAGDLA